VVWVALNIRAWRRDRAVFVSRQPALRAMSDLVLIFIGLFWAVCAVDELLGTHFSAWSWMVEGVNPSSDTESRMLWLALIAGLHLVWSAVLIYLFPRDLILLALDRASMADPGAIR
jgi:hypothetical protein